jgi:hypothetical protein
MNTKLSIFLLLESLCLFRTLAIKIIVSSSEKTFSCEECVYSKSFLKALEISFKHSGNISIILLDELYIVKKDAMDFLTEKFNRSLSFSDYDSEDERVINIEGAPSGSKNNNLNYTSLVFDSISISINVKRTTFNILKLKLIFNENVRKNSLKCLFCLERGISEKIFLRLESVCIQTFSDISSWIDSQYTLIYMRANNFDLHFENFYFSGQENTVFGSLIVIEEIFNLSELNERSRLVIFNNSKFDETKMKGKTKFYLSHTILRIENCYFAHFPMVHFISLKVC